MVQRQMGSLVADHTTGLDGGACCWRQGSKTRLRCDDGHEEDRRRGDRGGAPGLMTVTTRNGQLYPPSPAMKWRRRRNVDLRGKRRATIRTNTTKVVIEPFINKSPSIFCMMMLATMGSCRASS